MRAVIQRVRQAAVHIEGECHGKIGQGLLLLLGVEKEDGEEDVRWLLRKTLNLRIFNDETGRMNRSLMEIEGEILLVSQFTLHASTKKGNRPSFTRAADPDRAKKLYEEMIDLLCKETGKRPSTGKFGAYMQVELVNDGPVTLILDSKNKE